MNTQEEAIQKVKQNMLKIAGHPFAATKVGQVLDDALDSNGKMIRARILLLCSKFGNADDADEKRINMLAAMVELTHLASLIHDDIIDESDFRRGKPSIQNKYSKDAAVYAGDFLMARINYYEAACNLNESSMLLSQAIEGMCVGEIGQALCRYKESTKIEEYLENINGKTVALFKTACTIGAKESKASEEITQKLALIGEYLGYMFQLRDDLLDFTADKYHLGKEAHKDFAEGIYTLPVLAALKNDKDNKLVSIMKKNAKDSLDESEIRRAEELVIELGGVEYAKDAIKSYSTKIQTLLETLPDNEAKGLLNKLVKNLEEK